MQTKNVMDQDNYSDIGLQFKLILEKNKLALEITKQKDEILKLKIKMAEIDLALKKLNQKPRGRPRKMAPDIKQVGTRGRPSSDWESVCSSFEIRKQAFPHKTDNELINEIYGPISNNYHPITIAGWIKTFKNQLAIYRKNPRK